MNEGLLESIRAARRVATPIFSVETADQPGSQKLLAEFFGQEKYRGQPCPPNLLRWDTIGGFTGLNDPGKSALAEFCSGVDPSKVYKPEDALTLLANAPDNTVTLIHNAHRYVADAAVAQGIQNLREPYKKNRRALVLLAPRLALPTELQQDVIIMEEQLPDDPTLAAIVRRQYVAASKAPGSTITEEPDPGDLQRAIEALRGLSLYAAEQVCAMAMTPQGIHLGNLWNFKRKQLEQTPGLKMYPKKETFADIGGLEWLKMQFGRLFHGKRRPAAVIYMDELEKMLPGASITGGDNTGVAQDQLKSLLTWMENHNASGTILIGNPGAGKSLISKALGGEFNVPTLEMDLGDMKTSELGGSEANIRAALRAVEGIAGDRAFFIASCNQIDSIPPALQRRFRFGTFYAPLPDGRDLGQIWRINIQKFDLDGNQELPAKTLYTGADVRNMCDFADQMGISLMEAADLITPIAVSDPDSINRLSRFCHRHFRNAGSGALHEHVELAQLLGQSAEGGEGDERAFNWQS